MRTKFSFERRSYLTTSLPNHRSPAVASQEHQTPLLSALSNGHDEAAKALLEAGSDPKARCSKVRVPAARASHCSQQLQPLAWRNANSTFAAKKRAAAQQDEPHGNPFRPSQSSQGQR